MVWKYKLPSDLGQTAWTVYEIAKEIHVPAADIRRVLEVMGEYVDSNRKRTISQPVRRRIYLALGRQAPSTALPGSRGQTPSVYSDPSPALPPSARPTLSNYTAQGDDGRGVSDPDADFSDSMAMASWTLFGFDDLSRDAWLMVLRPGEVKAAAQLRAAGLTPADLHLKLAGWTVQKRLRAGEDPVDVKRLLDRAKAGGRMGNVS